MCGVEEMKSKSKGKRFGIDRFNQQLLDRIDSMPDPDSFSPYAPAKKTVIHDSDLFDSDAYDNNSNSFNEYEVDESSSKSGENKSAPGKLNILIFIIVFIMILAIIATVLYLTM